MRIVVLFIICILIPACSNSYIDEAGGAYAISPDGQWKAEISDGYSQDNKASYAVIRLWDLQKYPSLAEGISSAFGKIPQIKLEFPQDFNARDAKCDVSWREDATSFVIEYECKVIRDGKETLIERVFIYELDDNRFCLLDSS